MSRAARASEARGIHRAEVPGVRGRAGDASSGYRRPYDGPEEQAQHRVLQYHNMLPPGVPGVYYDYRERNHSAEGESGGSIFRSIEATAAYTLDEEGGDQYVRLEADLQCERSGRPGEGRAL